MSNKSITKPELSEYREKFMQEEIQRKTKMTKKEALKDLRDLIVSRTDNGPTAQCLIDLIDIIIKHDMSDSLSVIFQQMQIHKIALPKENYTPSEYNEWCNKKIILQNDFWMQMGRELKNEGRI